MSGGESWLEKRNSLKAREADDAARLGEAVEGVAMKRIAGELTKTFVENGVGKVVPDRTEQQRVDAIIRRDQIERVKEQDRQLAEMEVTEGVFINLADTVMEPTPEWMLKGEVRGYTPRQPNGTVREVKTVRRVVTPIYDRLHSQGKLSDDQRAACSYYRLCHEIAGLDGRWSSSRISLAGGGGGNGQSAHPMAMQEHEVEARNFVRLAREVISPSLLKMFEAVTIDDLPIRRAARFSRCSNDRALPMFRSACSDLVRFCEARNVQLSAGGNHDA